MKGRPTRAERLRMQEADDGHPNDTVWLATGGTHTSVYYHDDRDCDRLKASDAEPDTASRGKAQSRWLAPCTTCTPATRP